MGNLTRRFGAAALAAALAGCAGSRDARAGAGGDIAIARDYVFASCLIRTHPATPLAEEAEAWASGLVQRGSLPAEAYPALADLAATATAPVTRTGKPIPLQGCAALRDDPAVSAKIARIVGKAR